MGKSKTKLDIKTFVQETLHKAIDSQYPFALAHVERLRRVHPEKSPQEMIDYLNKVYLSVIAGAGLAAGATAVAPNVVVQIPVALAELAGYLEASVLYAYSVMIVVRLHAEDVERRTALVTAILIGKSAISAIEKAMGRTVQHWGKQLVGVISRDGIKNLNKILGPRFVTIAGKRAGVIVLSEQAPLMIGALLGAVVNTLFGIGVVKAAKKILGDVPATWDDTPDEPQLKIVKIVEKRALSKKVPVAKPAPKKAVAAKKSTATKTASEKTTNSKAPAKKTK